MAPDRRVEADALTEQVRSDLARTREQVAASVHALRTELAAQTNWREWVRRKPWVWLTGAFVLGVVVGKHGRRDGS
jgi:ElaB/YqjD/DUF883 family membrane-anchored ribosome-binding protein